MARNPRATKQALQERKETLLAFLSDGPKSTLDISFHLELSYPQTTLLLSKLECENLIERLPGRVDRKLFYQISSGLPKIVGEMLDPLVDKVGTVVNMAVVSGRVFLSLDSLIEFAESTPYEHVYGEIINLIRDERPEILETN